MTDLPATSPPLPRRRWQFGLPQLFLLVTCFAGALAMARLGGLSIGDLLLMLPAFAGLLAVLGLPGLIFARWGVRFGRPATIGSIGGAVGCVGYLALPAVGGLPVRLPLWLAAGFAGSAMGALAGLWYGRRADIRGDAILSNEVLFKRQRNRRLLVVLLLAGFAAVPYYFGLSSLRDPEVFRPASNLLESGLFELLGPSLVALPTIVGCAALWAALERGLFALRVACVSGLISLGMALEPVDLAILFGVQALAVMAIVRGVRWWLLRRTQSGLRRAWTFDLLALLAAVGLLDFASRDVAPAEEELAEGALSAGLLLAALTLVAAWAVVGRSRRWARRLLLVLASAVAGDCLLALVGGRSEWFSPSLDDFGWWWCAIALAISTTTGAWLWLWGFAARTLSADPQPGAARAAFLRPLARAAAAAMMVALAVSPALLWRRLVNWPAVPAPQLPTPNAFDELARVEELLRDVDVRSERSLAEKKSLVEGHRAALQAARRALVHESMVNPETFTSFPSTLVQVLHWEAEVAANEGRIDDAVHCYLDAQRVCRVPMRGGTFLHVSFGTRRTTDATGMLALLRPALTRAQRQEVIAAILSLNPLEEPLDRYVARGRDYFQQSCTTWRQRLFCLQADLEQYLPELMETARKSVAASATATRLLTTELALDNYYEEHGAWPASLAELVPDYLPEVPVDPYGGQPLVYRLGPDSFQLYSIGPDERDDGGHPGLDYYDPGDIFIEQFQPPPDDLPE